MYNCMEYQKKYKDVYWDSEKGMCVIPTTLGPDAIILIDSYGYGNFTGFLYK